MWRQCACGLRLWTKAIFNGWSKCPLWGRKTSSNWWHRQATHSGAQLTCDLEMEHMSGHPFFASLFSHTTGLDRHLPRSATARSPARHPTPALVCHLPRSSGHRLSFDAHCRCSVRDRQIWGLHVTSPSSSRQPIADVEQKKVGMSRLRAARSNGTNRSTFGSLIFSFGHNGSVYVDKDAAVYWTNGESEMYN
jgi:hypothetical protein